jgi:regulator of sigma E protease
MSPQTPAEFLIAVAGFIVAVGILVAVHEFGHFWVARRLGIKVLRFSIGFGKPWLKRVSGPDQVEYVLAMIPLGGYVKMLDEREAPVPAEFAHRAFNRQPVWKRVAVLLAGPMFNLIFAVLVYWFLFMVGIQATKPVIGEVKPDSIAAQAGLHEEDELLAVGGKSVQTQEAAVIALLDDVLDHDHVEFTVRGLDGATRTVSLPIGNQRQALTMPDALLPGLGFDFFFPRYRAVVGEIDPKSAADHAGLKVGDEIVKIDGTPIPEFADISKIIAPRPNRMVQLTVRRAGADLEIPLTVGTSHDDGPQRGVLGVRPSKDARISKHDLSDLKTLERYEPVRALGAATVKTWSTSIFTFKILGRIVTGDVSFKNISGPISIAEVTGFAVRQGLEKFLTILALISISLGVLNLLPVPILDGGQIVYQLAELVKGRPVSERALILGQQVGIALLILLMGLAFYNDIARHLD